MKIPSQVDAEGWLKLVVPGVRSHREEYAKAVSEDGEEACFTGSLLAIDFVNALRRSGYPMRGSMERFAQVIEEAQVVVNQRLQETRNDPLRGAVPDPHIIKHQRIQTQAMYELLAEMDEQSKRPESIVEQLGRLHELGQQPAGPPQEVVVRVVLDDDTKRWLESALSGTTAGLAGMISSLMMIRR